MPRKTRCLFLLGTRPEAIKLAPVLRECVRRNQEIHAMVCLTGQHREMLEQVCDYFGISADVDLELMQPDQKLEDLTSRCLVRVSEVLDRHRPDCVIAQGDTTTVFAGSVAAFYRRIPFVHIEAGLRSGDLQHPWPEEFNRRAVSITAALHCAPTRRAADHLLAEGAAPATVFITGNTVIDALLWTIKRERSRARFWARKHAPLGGGRMVLITGHRRENFGKGFESICAAVGDLATRFGDVQFVYPVHLNPNVRRPVRRILAAYANVHLIEPVAYPEFVWLMDRSTLILTDSGGVQEEAPSLRKPVLIMRQTTERPEAVEAGAAELVGCNRQMIVDRVSLLLTDPTALAQRQVRRNPYGDGRASERIVELLASAKFMAEVRPCPAVSAGGHGADRREVLRNARRRPVAGQKCT
jgi:UDP-N-acetylglucosamine 2-epimerase (non-hydrolysing)